MTPRALTTIVLLVLAALGSWYLSRSNQADEVAGILEPAHRGYYLKSARILGTDADGSLLYEINAARAEQQADERILFSDVRIEYSPDSQVPWSIVADTATLLPDQALVLLEGHVRAISSEGFSGNETEIRTQALQLDPERFVAQTDARVQLRIGARSLTGTGMLASLNDNTLELKSNVSGRFIR